MIQTTLRKQWQVTLPDAVIREWELGDGDLLEVWTEQGEIRIRPAGLKKGWENKGAVRRLKGKPAVADCGSSALAGCQSLWTAAGFPWGGKRPGS